MVEAVGEIASMKRRKLWKTGEDGLCFSSSAIQTRPGLSSLLEERSEIPIVFVVSFVLSATPQTGGKRPRYIDIRYTSCSLSLSLSLGLGYYCIIFILFYFRIVSLSFLSSNVARFTSVDSF